MMSEIWKCKGFANAHTHLDKGMLVPEVVYVDAPASIRGGWTREKKAEFTKMDIYDRAEKALLQMIRYGTTYVRTHVDVDPVVGLTGIEAMLELQQAYAKQIVIDITAFNQEGFDRYPETEKLLQEALTMGRMGLGGHTLVDVDGKLHIRKMMALAEQFDVPWLEFHTDESGKPEDFLLPFLAERALEQECGDKIYAIHCNSLATVPDLEAAKTIELMANAKLHVTVCPTAVATRPITRTKELLKAGIPVALGSDNMGDLFNPLGGGNMLGYAQLLAYVQRFYEPEEQLAILDMIRRGPADPLSASSHHELYVSVVFETQEARELLSHVPLPQIVQDKVCSA